MAYKLKTENFEKRPRSGMRHLWTQAWGNDIATMPATRILFSLKVKEILAGPNGALRKEQLKAWRARREADRASRREVRSNA